MTDAKPLCEWSRRDVQNAREQYRAATARARYVCRHCARVAVDLPWLCEPQACPTNGDEAAAAREAVLP